jgi:hypothetical protein
MFDYWKWDCEVPDWLCNQIISEIDWDATQKAKVGEEKNLVVDENIRVSRVAWKENYSPIGCIAQTFIHMANKNANWNFDLTNCEQIQIGKYEKNEKYDWHFDVDNQLEEIRKLSISILLNDNSNFM